MLGKHFYNKIYISKQDKKQAFTLAEVLVSLFIFVIIASILMQIYVTTIRSERVAYTLLRNENIIRNVLEMIGRDIRMGQDFVVEDDSISFSSFYDGFYHQIIYRYNSESNQIEKKEDEGDFVALTPPEIDILRFRFYGNQFDTMEHLSITIVLNVTATVYNQSYPINLETTVTPRVLNL
mgnify:CR=1 FL=1